ncbi:phosphomannomutase/phosphoglucomutase [Pseudoteredinibacter isoporae]|uniref:phosphomannomutase n=1 Tax=Pseudoteredinibacter isoporae TaxID=570281 RepID=A0A7X0JS75_9GAMM|nr:phosphomannomutase/phosphoglucomutase [Pseudoteredinibacter isoporae]MBB6520416.1 phosphomannomutase/phosphoglucomutase [Pseudoteredinibacter isoporae]NHO85984.1 phosphomannomutase/phosphoglucomutase [Pseudoteredinibacter isoporae]NIB25564.1 phosphomannomutase/phosphoglucomutase [Pseudoteredinibacter isoporae]
MRIANIKNWGNAEKQTAAILCGLLFICIGVGAWYYQRYVVIEAEQALDKAIDSMVSTQVDAIGHRIGSLNQDLRRFTSREALTKAIVQQEPVTIRSFMSSLEKAFPKAISIRIIPRGTAKLDREHAAPIRFAELDMITRAENHQPITVEAANIEERWQFNLLAPIPHSQDQTPVATLMVTLDQRAIAQLLRDADQDSGRFELLQQFGRHPAQLIIGIGKSDSQKNLTKDIPNTLWKLRYSPSHRTVNAAGISLLPFLSIWFLATALLLSGAFQLCRRKYAPHSSRTSRTAQEFDQKVRDHQLTNGRKMDDILDIEVNADDENLLGEGFDTPSRKGGTLPQLDIVNNEEDHPAPVSDELIPEEVFRAYDIRGLADPYLSPAFVHRLGQALGSEAIDQGEETLIVARDCRVHSPEICEQLIAGITSTGCNVLDLGIVPTPLLYFACHVLPSSNSGVIVTASHNGPKYNGFKMVFNRNTISDQGIQYIKQRMQQQAFASSDASGQVSQQDISAEYIEQIFSDIALAGDITVVIDAGNGATSEIAPRLFEELGCTVIPMYCEFDGRFPNHAADPSRERNMRDLIKAVRKHRADLGIAFDGDGDRLGVVTPEGKIIWPDRQLMLFAKDIVSRNPGTDVLFDVKCTRQLNSLVSSYGGRPIMWKTGHSLMKAKMAETGALLGGELSGHIFFKERWFGFDDGMYSAARLMEIMSLRDQDLDTIFSSFPELPATPEIKIDVEESEKFQIIEDLISHGHFEDGRLTTIDGLRVDFAHGWGLVRASNTSPALTLRFEANTEEQLQDIQEHFRAEIAKIAPSISF